MEGVKVKMKCTLHIYIVPAVVSEEKRTQTTTRQQK